MAYLCPQVAHLYVTDETNLGFCTDKVNPIREFIDRMPICFWKSPKLENSEFTPPA